MPAIILIILIRRREITREEAAAREVRRVSDEVDDVNTVGIVFMKTSQ